MRIEIHTHIIFSYFGTKYQNRYRWIRNSIKIVRHEIVSKSLDTKSYQHRWIRNRIKIVGYEIISQYDFDQNICHLKSM